MAMALAVAMVACQAATPKPAEKGDPGEQGEAGPAGPPGTTDNDQPMVTKSLPMVYLAMAGTGIKKTSDALDLSDHFADTEKATLNYTFSSNAADVATAELSGGKMVVKGKKAGTATITVMVYDGVTDPVSETFDVMVVAQNAKPVVDFNPATLVVDAAVGADAIDDNAGSWISTANLGTLRGKLYRLRGASETTITALIHAGVAGTFQDEVMFSIDMGAAGTDDDIVKVDITPKMGVANMWTIKLTPLKPGMQNVYVTVKDKFGVPAELPDDVDNDTDGPDTVVPQRFQFVALVNTVPSLEKELPDKTVVAAAAADVEYSLSEFFNTDEKPFVKGPKIGDMEDLAPIPSLAALGTATGEARANDTTCTATETSSDAAVSVPAVNITETLTITIGEASAGTFDVTVTCQDAEGFATDTATITIRASR